MDLKAGGVLAGAEELEYKGKSAYFHFFSNDEYGQYAMEAEWIQRIKALGNRRSPDVFIIR